MDPRYGILSKLLSLLKIQFSCFDKDYKIPVRQDFSTWHHSRFGPDCSLLYVCVGVLSCNCRKSCSIPGLGLLDASSTIPISCDKKYLYILPNVPLKVKLFLSENYCSKYTPSSLIFNKTSPRNIWFYPPGFREWQENSYEMRAIRVENRIWDEKENYLASLADSSPISDPGDSGFSLILGRG